MGSGRARLEASASERSQESRTGGWYAESERRLGAAGIAKSAIACRRWGMRRTWRGGEFDDASLDRAGRRRSLLCANRALPARPGGVLVGDNANSFLHPCRDSPSRSRAMHPAGETSGARASRHGMGRLQHRVRDVVAVGATASRTRRYVRPAANESLAQGARGRGGVVVALSRSSGASFSEWAAVTRTRCSRFRPRRRAAGGEAESPTSVEFVDVESLRSQQHGRFRDEEPRPRATPVSCRSRPRDRSPGFGVREAERFSNGCGSRPAGESWNSGCRATGSDQSCSSGERGAGAGTRRGLTIYRKTRRNLELRMEAQSTMSSRRRGVAVARGAVHRSVWDDGSQRPRARIATCRGAGRAPLRIATGGRTPTRPRSLYTLLRRGRDVRSGNRHERLARRHGNRRRKRPRDQYPRRVVRRMNESESERCGVPAGPAGAAIQAYERRKKSGAPGITSSTTRECARGTNAREPVTIPQRPWTAAATMPPPHDRSVDRGSSACPRESEPPGGDLALAVWTPSIQ